MRKYSSFVSILAPRKKNRDPVDPVVDPVIVKINLGPARVIAGQGLWASEGLCFQHY